MTHGEMIVEALAATHARLGVVLDPPENTCVMHLDHSPRSLLLEIHSVFPRYLQEIVWGKGIVRDTETVTVCPTGRANIRLALVDLLSNRAWRYTHSSVERRYALRGYDKFVRAMNDDSE